MRFIRPLFFWLLLIGILFSLFLKVPFGLWDPIDRLRFEIYSSKVQLFNHIFPTYNSISLLNKIENPPAWMTNQIEEDLSGIKKVSSRKIENFLETIPYSKQLNHYQLVTVIIDETGVRTAPDALPTFDGRRRSVIEALKVLHELGQLRPCQFLLSVADEIEIPHAGLPIFAFSKNKERKEQKNLVLLPDGMNLSRWSIVQKTIGYASEAYDWQKKEKTIFWRGSNTNRMRERLCDVAKDLPYVDAKLSKRRDSVYEIPEMQLKYKYLISLDGNTSAWPGLLWKLASNSLVIKQESPHIQWYYQALEPFVHYFPIQRDLSDLKEGYAYVTHHDHDMRRISQQAVRFVEENLSYEDMLVYLKLLMDAYCDKVYRPDGMTSNDPAFMA